MYHDVCCTDHNQYHETFSCNKDSLSSACSALNCRHIEFVLIVFHSLTIFCCCQTQDGFSPVYVASQNGHTEVVELLLQAGADIHLASTDEVYASTHTVSSSVAAVVETNVRLIISLGLPCFYIGIAHMQLFLVLAQNTCNSALGKKGDAWVPRLRTSSA